LLNNGITAVHSMDGDLEHMEIFLELERSKLLKMRLFIPFTMFPTTPMSRVSEALEMRKRTQDLVKGGFCKFFLDGVVETSTAFMLDSYEGAKNRGYLQWDPELYKAAVALCYENDLGVATHAVGDGAVRFALDTYEAVSKQHAKSTTMPRIEHVEVAHLDDLPRFAKLGVTASMQCLHVVLEWDLNTTWNKQVGRERFERSWPLKWLQQHGACVVFGSDHPIVSCSVIEALQVTLMREGINLDHKDFKARVCEILHAFTTTPALLESPHVCPTSNPLLGIPHLKRGRLCVGCAADIVVLSANVLQTPLEQMDTIHVVQTIFSGETQL